MDLEPMNRMAAHYPRLQKSFSNSIEIAWDSSNLRWLRLLTMPSEKDTKALASLGWTLKKQLHHCCIWNKSQQKSSNTSLQIWKVSQLHLQRRQRRTRHWHQQRRSMRRDWQNFRSYEKVLRIMSPITKFYRFRFIKRRLYRWRGSREGVPKLVERGNSSEAGIRMRQLIARLKRYLEC